MASTSKTGNIRPFRSSIIRGNTCCLNDKDIRIIVERSSYVISAPDSSRRIASRGTKFVTPRRVVRRPVIVITLIPKSRPIINGFIIINAGRNHPRQTIPRLLYIPPQHIKPDKALDLLDEACARARIPTISAPVDLGTGLVVTARTVAEVLSGWVGVEAEGLLENTDR